MHKYKSVFRIATLIHPTFRFSQKSDDTPTAGLKPSLPPRLLLKFIYYKAPKTLACYKIYNPFLDRNLPPIYYFDLAKTCLFKSNLYYHQGVTKKRIQNNSLFPPSRIELSRSPSESILKYVLTNVFCTSLPTRQWASIKPAIFNISLPNQNLLLW